MSDIETRSFSKDYRLVLRHAFEAIKTNKIFSGLVIQSAVAIGLAAACVISHEFVKNQRRSRGKLNNDSRESWKFG